VLARKIGTAMPSLTEQEHAQIAAQAWETLAILARDTAEQVRATVADTLKQLPGVPRGIILDLARDPSFLVSDPILRLSPALTEQDLFALISDRPAPHTLRSIAARPTLGAALCDTIAASADKEAVATLLNNHSAALCESTLDALVTQAARRISWHEPIVHRPGLSAAQVRKLSNFISDQLLNALMARTDLSKDALDAVRSRLAKPLDAAGTSYGAVCPRSWLQPSVQPKYPEYSNAEQTLVTAIARSDVRQIEMILAVSAGLTIRAIRAAAHTRNARAAVALLWKGGFSMRPAPAIQMLLFGLAPSALLAAGPKDTFPLSTQEMQATIDLMAQTEPET
ncbi:MAG: DUF2336 domain-containing protein, partial [Acidocella sp.]|nr:DUF2336 domain-containing protein [Acidocella sp.]